MDFWEVLKYALLGLIQGITEPIPVSSSGHLIIVERLFGIHIEGMSFEVLVNTASLLAIVWIYRKDLSKLVISFFRYIAKREARDYADFRMGLYLILATIPAAVLGYLYSDEIGDLFKGMTTIGIALLFTALALWIIRNLRGNKGDKDLSLRDTFLVGLTQAIALIPGISRSGSTIVTAMLLGWKQETALKFSFFLYIPVSVGGMILTSKDLVNDPQISQLMLPYAAAFLCSLVATYFALKWFMNIMAKGNLAVFSIYCVIAGLSVLIFL